MAAIAAACAFYFGMQFGLSMFNSMQVRNRLYDSVTAMRVTTAALDALDKNDLVTARAPLELTLDSALTDFSIYADALSYRECEPKVAAAVGNARNYRATHPGPMQATSAKGLVEKALASCSVGQPAK